MSMKIDGHRQPTDTEATRRSDSANAPERLGTAGAAGVQKAGVNTDRVEVSSEAQFVSAAIRAAEDSPSVRPEAVARARKALEEGTLGTDADRLADRIINSLLSD